MITSHKAQELMLLTNNPHLKTALETIVDLWRMFGEANRDAVEAQDEIDAIRRSALEQPRVFATEARS